MENNALIDMIVKILRGSGATDQAAQALEGRGAAIDQAVPTMQNPGMNPGLLPTTGPSLAPMPPAMPPSWRQ